MIMPPGVPRAPLLALDVRRRAGEAVSFGEGTKIAVGILVGQQLGDESFQVAAQPGISGGVHHLGGPGQILAGEFTRPGQQVSVGRPVAIGKHGQHGRVGIGRRQQPVGRDGIEIPPRDPASSRRRALARSSGGNGPVASPGGAACPLDTRPRRIMKNIMPSHLLIVILCTVRSPSESRLRLTGPEAIR